MDYLANGNCAGEVKKNCIEMMRHAWNTVGLMNLLRSRINLWNLLRNRVNLWNLLRNRVSFWNLLRNRVNRWNLLRIMIVSIKIDSRSRPSSKPSGVLLICCSNTTLPGCQDVSMGTRLSGNSNTSCSHSRRVHQHRKCGRRKL